MSSEAAVTLTRSRVRSVAYRSHEITYDDDDARIVARIVSYRPSVRPSVRASQSVDGGPRAVLTHPRAS